MHSDWFNGIEILKDRWQHGEKVGYCYLSGLVKILFTRQWDMLCPVGHERVKTVVCTMGQILREKEMDWFLMDHQCDCITLANMVVNNRSIWFREFINYMGDYQLIQQYPADRRLTFHILSHIS
jgi:hypothetical protein